MPKQGETVVTDRRAAGLPEPVAGATDKDSIGAGGVSRIAGVERKLNTGGDPLAFLPPVVAAVDPKGSPDAIGAGGVTRQSGVIIRDATTPGVTRVDVPAELVGGSAIPTLLSDRAANADEPQVIVGEQVQSMAAKPVAGGTVEVSRVNEALHRQAVTGGLDVLQSDRRATKDEPQVHIGEAAGQALPAEQLAAFREGRVFAADRPHRHPAPAAEPGVRAVETKATEVKQKRSRQREAKNARGAAKEAPGPQSEATP